jgi:mono/diheme cytochrome c family protein
VQRDAEAGKLATAMGPRICSQPARKLHHRLLVVGFALVVGCSAGAHAAQPSGSPATARWYTPSQVTLGQQLYQAHCAGCHGARAQGAPDWDKAGIHPAPPLNGSGHSAHHELHELESSIEHGKGAMPAFAAVLGHPERRAVLAYLQSLWPEDIYRGWQTMSAAGKRAGHSGHQH